MGVFYYRARNNHAELFTGKVIAENIHDAAFEIRSKGLWVVQLDEEVSKISWQEKIKNFLMQDINIPGLSSNLGRQEEVLFFCQLSSMLQAGLPLQQALRAMANHGDKVLYQKMKKQLEQDVSNGRRLWESMARYPQVFPETVRACVRAGEESGSLGDILQYLSLHLKESLKAVEKLKSMLIYPIFLLVMMGISIFAVLIFILPTFAELLRNIHGEIPWATAILLDMADSMGTLRGKLLLLGAFGSTALGLYAIWQEPRCRLLIDKNLMAVPVLGKLIMHSEWLRVLGTLAVLLKSGLQLSKALKMVEYLPHNTYIKFSINRVQQQVEQGQTFTKALSLCQYVPWQALELLAAGEKAGCLEKMFFESAGICQEQAGHESERLLVMVEPALILLLGSILLFLVMAIIMPVLNVMDVLV